MHAYLPSSLPAALVVVGLGLCTLTAGFGIGRMQSRWALPIAWLLLPLSVLATHGCLVSEAPGLRMLALVVVALFAMKAVVVASARRRSLAPFSMLGWSGFAAAWFGMRPTLFLARPQKLDDDGLIVRGVARSLVGIALLVAASVSWSVTGEIWFTAPLLLIGISLCLHFGLCNVVAGCWRRRGVAVHALFCAPLRSRSLAEFWGRRWNLAFSEMAAATVYRPVARRLGRIPGLLATFLFSALLHEVAISLPVGAGFGGPTAYFVLHGTLVAFERALEDRGMVLRGRWARAWTVCWVVVPLPLLFHRPFLEGVLLPLVGG